MNVYIWIDDERPINAPPFDWGMIVHAHNYAEAVDFLRGYCEGPNEVFVSFDHDLGEGPSGYDIAKWLLENDFHVYYRVHSMNPVGRANIEQLLDHYGYERF